MRGIFRFVCLLLLLGSTGGCAEPPPAGRPDPAPAATPEPPPTLPDWVAPAPEVRIDRISGTDTIRIPRDPEHLVVEGPRGRLVQAGALAPGDVLRRRTPEGLTAVEVLSVGPGGRADVFELRVSAPDTYFANGVLVHNY